MDGLPTLIQYNDDQFHGDATGSPGAVPIMMVYVIYRMPASE